jgi:glycosyltransferase involved in cell wall biosynthesis
VISVVICTRNRSRRLRQALESLGAMRVEAGRPWEIVVVDNNSTDDTRTQVHEFARASGLNVRSVLEPAPGLSHARNRGLQVSKGAVVAFTDDDVVVDAAWLNEVIREFETYPDTGILFGQTRRPPSGGAGISVKEDGVRQAYAYPSPPWVIGHGNNMSVRRSAAERIGSFDTRLGAGTAAGSAEDTDYVYRALKGGHQVVYAPSPIVYHHHDRLSPRDELRARAAYARGRGAFYCKHLLRGDRWVWRGLLGEVKSSVIAAATVPERRTTALRTLAALLGGVVLRLLAEAGGAVRRRDRQAVPPEQNAC